MLGDYAVQLITEADKGGNRPGNHIRNADFPVGCGPGGGNPGGIICFRG